MDDYGPRHYSCPHIVRTCLQKMVTIGCKSLCHIDRETANVKRKGDKPWVTKAEKRTRIRARNRRKAKTNKSKRKSKTSSRKRFRERKPEPSKNGLHLVTIGCKSMCHNASMGSITPTPILLWYKNLHGTQSGIFPNNMG